MVEELEELALDEPGPLLADVPVPLLKLGLGLGHAASLPSLVELVPELLEGKLVESFCGPITGPLAAAPPVATHGWSWEPPVATHGEDWSWDWISAWDTSLSQNGYGYVF